MQSGEEYCMTTKRMAMWFFFWMILVKKNWNFFVFHFWRKKDMKMFDDVPDRKQTFLDDKNIHLAQSKN